MIVLGLDTATFTSSAALVDGEGVVLGEGTLDTSGRGDDLLVRIDEICRQAGVTPRQITAVAVGAGPGSFTGLRIGMATAKGIAFAAGCPLWLVSSLAAMAAELAAEAAGASAGRLLVPVLDARRGEVFAGFFYHRAGEAGHAVSLAEAAAEQVLAPEALAAAIDRARAHAEPDAQSSAAEAAVCCGDAIEVFDQALAPLAPQWRPVGRTPSGRWVARLALLGQREDLLRSGRPAYLRPAEAEIMYPDGVPGVRRAVVLPPLREPEPEKP
jgi:tRNA threonylcarbamoyladenosine biosynthesis protein TsaB